MRRLALIICLLLAASTALAQNADSCGACNGVSHRDSCLIGDWETNRNGPAEWLQRQGVPMTPVESTTYKLSFHNDGRYVIHDYAYDFTINYGGHTVFGGAETAGGSGCWTADGVDVHLCHADGGPIVHGEVRFRGALHTVNRRMFDAPKTIWQYNCGGALRLTIPTDKAHAPITTQMFRPGMAPPALPRRMPE